MVMLGVSFTSNLIVSLVAPILPWHLQEIGVSQIWCGVMFAMFPFATLVATPFTKSAIGRVGRVPLLFTGLIMQSLSTVAFGFADDITGGVGVKPAATLAVFVLSRVICGFGASLANTAIFAVAVERFGGQNEGEQNRLGVVNGWNEVAIGLGFTLGPPVGNTLYLSGGFKFPFVVTALIVLAFSPCAFLLRQPSSAHSSDADSKAQVGLLEVLKPGLLLPAGSVFLGTAIFGLVEPVLSLYLQNSVGVTPAGVGPMFAAFAATYSGCSPLAGMSADRIGAGRVCAFGTLASGLILAVLLGPAGSLLRTGSTLRISYEAAGLMLLGVTQALTLIPTLSAMGEGLGSDADKPGAEDCVSAWFVMFLNLGLSVGPIIGTFIVDSIGFENAMAVCGLGIAAYGALAVAMDKRFSNKSRKIRRTTSNTITIGTPNAMLNARAEPLLDK